MLFVQTETIQLESLKQKSRMQADIRFNGASFLVGTDTLASVKFDFFQLCSHYFVDYRGKVNQTY